MHISNASQAVHFDGLSGQWWNESGAFGVLHAMNPARVMFIKNLINEHFSHKKMENLKILDVGCGGGILCEPLTRLGANVSGIDASKMAIEVANEHSSHQNLNIDYKCVDINDISDTFDIVTCLEVIEHVDDLPKFATDLIKKINQGGLLILSTINRTWFSYLVGIVGAEYITRMVPIGTHDWHKFVEPAQVVELFESIGLQPLSLNGLNYSLLKREWQLGKDLRMNYLVGFMKN